MREAAARALCLEARNAVTGEMLLAALLDLTHDDRRLQDVLGDALAAPPFSARLTVDRTEAHGLPGTILSLKVDPDVLPSSLDEVRLGLAGSSLPRPVAERAIVALGRLAAAVAAVHGAPIARVSLGDLGGAGAVGLIAGVLLLVHELAVTSVFVGPIDVGPVAPGSEPSPGRGGAVALELLRGAVVTIGGEDAPPTPVAALLLTELPSSGGRPPPLELERVGYGLSAPLSPSSQSPRVLRALLGVTRTASADLVDGAGGGLELVLLEANIDDATPEALAYLQERVLAAGARDCWMAGVSMKKGRPGVQMSVLAEGGAEEALVDLMFAESGTFGVRRRAVERHVLDRSWLTVTVDGLAVRVKVGRRHGRVVTLAPEYEEAAAAAAVLRRPLRDVMHEALETARRMSR